MNEDLLQLHHDARDRLVDVGWYPESNPDGAFKLVVFERDFSGRRLLEFRTPDLGQLIDRLHAVLNEP